MPKKQVAVSLRKPPSPETLEAFVNGGAEPPAEEPRPSSRRARSRAVKAAEPAAVEQTSVMTEPPTPAPPSAETIPPASSVAAKAAEEARTEQILPPAMEPSPLPPMVGATGMALRPVTVYLPQALADKLTLHCIDQDRDASNVIAAALEQHLAPRLGPGTPPPSSRPAEEPPRTWREPPFDRAGFAGSNKIEQILEIGRLIVGLVRRRSYAG